VAVEHQLLVGDVAVLQQALGLDAVGAAFAGEHHHFQRLFGVGRDVAQHGVGIGDLEGIARLVRLDEHLHHLAVLHQHGVAPGALAETEVVLVHQHAHAFGELAVAVRDEHDFIGLLFGLPGIHDEGVVDRDAGDGVDTVLAEHRCQFVVARHVGGGAGGSEGAGQGEQHHGLALEDVVAGDVDPFMAAAGTEHDEGDALALTIL
jgi:hypothetical protein